MICSVCKINKSRNEFYFIDGGLAFTQEKLNTCKVCVEGYNQTKKPHKYYDEQLIAQYYGAKSVINNKKISDISRKIDNGIKEGSNRMGIQNFLYLMGEENGLSSASKQQRKVFNNLNKNLILDIIYPDEIIEKDLIEGAKKEVLVNAYERNPKARQQCIKEYGYNCFICGLNFEKIYGDIGKGFIHVHHIKPLSEIKEEYIINPIEDLKPVCPNCHAMLHKKNPPYTIEEIKNKITFP